VLKLLLWTSTEPRRNRSRWRYRGVEQRVARADEGSERLARRRDRWLFEPRARAGSVFS
jgi:hypothetical protein